MGHLLKLLLIALLCGFQAEAQTPVTINVSTTPAPATSTYSPSILKGGDNEGLETPDETGVVTDNLAAAQNAGFEPRQFRTVGDQFSNGTTTMGLYQPFYTNGGQQILPANYLAGYTYTDRTSVNGNAGQSRAVTSSSPYPGQQANTVSGGPFSITSNAVTWAVAAPTFTGSTTNGSNSITISGTSSLYSGLLLIQSGLQSGTTILSVSYNSGSNTTTLVVSLPATATATGSIAYSAFLPLTVIIPSGYANTYLNNYLLTVSSVTATSITASGGGFTYANVGATSDTGILTAWLAFTMAALPNATAAGDVYTLEKIEAPTPSSAWATGAGNIYTTCPASQLASNVANPLSGSQSLSIIGNGCMVASVFDNGTNENGVNINRFVSLDGTYPASVLARVESGSGALTMSLVRAAGGTLCTQNFTATSTSARYTFTSCTPHENSSTAITGAAELQVFNTGGGTITYDDLQIAKSGKSPNNTTVFRDEVIAAKQYGNGMAGTSVLPAGTSKVSSTLRDWLLEERSIQSLMMPQNTAPQNWLGTPGNEQHSNSPQLPDFMAESYLVGAIPHFVIPCTVRNDEAALYSQILFSTNTSTGGGAMRLAAGSAQPYFGPTGLFRFGILEMCNENWNTAFPGFTIPPRPTAYNGLADYGAAAGTFFAAMRSDPSFIPSAVYLMVNEQYGLTSPWTDTNSAAPLPVMKALGGAPDGFTTAAYTQGLAYANFDNEADAWLAATTEAAVSGEGNVWFPSPTAALQALNCNGSAKCKVEIYEQNNATGATCGMNGTPACDGSGHHTYITQAAMTAIQAGAGEAFVAANQIKAQTDAGYLATNQFGMSGFSANPFLNNQAGTAQLNNRIWGEAIDMGGLRSYLDRAKFGGMFSPRPNLIGRHLYNKAIIGQVVTLTNSTPTYNFAGDTANGPIPAQTNVPSVLAQATTDGAGNMGLWLSNPSPTASYTVTFAGAGAPAGTCSTEMLSPSSLNALNDSVAGAVESSATPQVYTSTTSGACPSSMTLGPRQMATYSYSTGTAAQIFTLACITAVSITIAPGTTIICH